MCTTDSTSYHALAKQHSWIRKQPLVNCNSFYKGILIIEIKQQRFQTLTWSSSKVFHLNFTEDSRRLSFRTNNSFIINRWVAAKTTWKWINTSSNLSLLDQELLASTPPVHVAILKQLIHPHNLHIKSPIQQKKSKLLSVFYQIQSVSNQCQIKSEMNIHISSASSTTWARSVERRSTRSLETIPLSGWTMSEATGMRTVGTNTATSWMMLRRFRPLPPIVYFLGIDGPHPIFTSSEQ